MTGPLSRLLMESTCVHKLKNSHVSYCTLPAYFFPSSLLVIEKQAFPELSDSFWQFFERAEQQGLCLRASPSCCLHVERTPAAKVHAPHKKSHRTVNVGKGSREERRLRSGIQSGGKEAK